MKVKYKAVAGTTVDSVSVYALWYNKKVRSIGFRVRVSTFIANANAAYEGFYMNIYIL